MAGVALPELTRFDVGTHRVSGEGRALLWRALKHFAEAQSLIELVSGGERALPVTYGLVDTLELARANQPATPEITVTSLKLFDNWYSHTWGLRSVITAADWGDAFAESADAPPSAPDAYLLQELTCAVLLISSGLPEAQLGHIEMSGCLSDVCVNKPDMVIKLRSGFLCNRCRELISSTGISGVYFDAIQSLLDRARLLALGRTPQRRLPDSAAVADDAFLDRQSILFLGFGLNDPLDLDLALRSADLSGAAQGEKFALLHEKQASTVRERFLNVEVMSYREHGHIPSILAVWAREAMG